MGGLFGKNYGLSQSQLQGMALIRIYQQEPDKQY